MNFQDANILEQISQAQPEALDMAGFGIVAMDKAGTVETYNAFESKAAGLSVDKVVGKHFFTAVAPCTNNYMVAQRFESEEELDDTIDYVFTLRMRPTKVRLRMLKSASASQQYLLVERR